MGLRNERVERVESESESDAFTHLAAHRKQRGRILEASRGERPNSVSKVLAMTTTTATWKSTAVGKKIRGKSVAARFQIATAQTAANANAPTATQVVRESRRRKPVSHTAPPR